MGGGGGVVLGVFLSKSFCRTTQTFTQRLLSKLLHNDSTFHCDPHKFGFIVLSLSHTMRSLRRFRRAIGIAAFGLSSIFRPPARSTSKARGRIAHVLYRRGTCEWKARGADWRLVKRSTERRSNKMADSSIRMSPLFFRVSLLRKFQTHCDSSKEKRFIFVLGA